MAFYYAKRLPEWTERQFLEAGLSPTLVEILFALVLAVVLALGVVLWLLIGFAWLVGPVAAVEEVGWLGAIREWSRLLREQFGRIVISEGLVVFLGLAAALPLTLAAGMATGGGPQLLPAVPWGYGVEGTNWVQGGVRAAVLGLAAGPLVTLLAVANVSIYLNLRYDYSPSK